MFGVCVLTSKPGFKSDHVSSPQSLIEEYGWILGLTGDKAVIRTTRGIVEYRVDERVLDKFRKHKRETLIRYSLKHGSGDVITGYSVIAEPLEEPPIRYETRDPGSISEFVEYYPWWLRKDKYRSVLLLEDYLLRIMRGILYSEGFIELLPPMISIVSDPGLRGAGKLKTKLYGETLELTSSVIMYKQSSVAVYDRVFFVARNVREEPPGNVSTERHLVEFTQLDIEEALAEPRDVMKLAEKVLYESMKIVADKYSDLVRLIGYRKEPVVYKPPYPVITYDEALEILGREGLYVKWGKELSQEAETRLAEKYGTPVWLVKFPRISRGFYYYPDPDDPRYNMDFNLILPHGYGEVIDGGMREYRYREILERIKSLGEDPSKYKWFLELAKQGGIPPSSGWGLGVERYTRFIAGLPHIAYAAYHPKLPGYPVKY